MGVRKNPAAFAVAYVLGSGVSAADENTPASSEPLPTDASDEGDDDDDGVGSGATVAMANGTATVTIDYVEDGNAYELEWVNADYNQPTWACSREYIPDTVCVSKKEWIGHAL